MSVLSCSRYRCPNIMCDRYSFVYGYLCADCFAALVDEGADADINEFLNSEPVKKSKARDSFDLWNAEFPIL